MLTRSFWASGIFVAVSAMFVWTGCSGESDGEPPATPGDDAGPGADANPEPQGPPDEDKDDEKRPDPKTVPIEYGQCADFNACGGDFKGYWTVSGGCLSDEFLADFKQGECAGVKEKDVVIKASGSLDVRDKTMVRKVTLDLSAKVEIPQACIDSFELPGGGSCALVQLGLTLPFPDSPLPSFDTATCTQIADGCECEVAVTDVDEAEIDYTASGNTVTTEDPSRTFDYCVSGNKNTFKETTSGSIPVVIELTK